MAHYSTARTAHVEPIVVEAGQMFVLVADRLAAVQEAPCVVEWHGGEVEAAAVDQ